MKRAIRAAAVLGVALTCLVTAPGAASAHPLGNFTVNLYGGIVIEPSRSRSDYVMDLAEIPTYQEMVVVDANRDGRAEATELKRYALRKAPALLRNVTVTADGRPVALRVEVSHARLRPGQGGLPILRLEAVFDGRIDRSGVLRYRDRNAAGRIGWREVTAVGASGEIVARSTVPAHSISDALLHYPTRLLSDPLHVTRASLSFRPGRSGAAPALPTDRSVATRPGITGGTFARLATWSGLSIPIAVGALLLAAAFGAAHALLPGHGKTIMAAYLVGAGGQIRQAIQVGVAVALMHTASVLLLGIAVLALTTYAPEQAYPWLTLVSGVAVLALGTYLVWSRVIRRVRRSRVAWRSDDHHHEDDHDHGPASHEHAHVPLDRPLSRRSLAGLAVAGGILPSPTALVVLLSTIHQHRVVFGLALIAAFSVGLATALMGVGVVALRAQRLVQRRLRARWASLVPVASAAAIFSMGIALVTQAATRM
jgi:nickel/cobalt exporter